MKKILLAIFLVITIASCSNQTVDVKSPCVSNDDGPCGPKKSINNWWLPKQKS